MSYMLICFNKSDCRPIVVDKFSCHAQSMSLRTFAHDRYVFIVEAT